MNEVQAWQAVDEPELGRKLALILIFIRYPESNFIVHFEYPPGWKVEYKLGTIRLTSPEEHLLRHSNKIGHDHIVIHSVTNAKSVDQMLEEERIAKHKLPYFTCHDIGEPRRIGQSMMGKSMRIEYQIEDKQYFQIVVMVDCGYPLKFAFHYITTQGLINESVFQEFLNSKVTLQRYEDLPRHPYADAVLKLEYPALFQYDMKENMYRFFYSPVQLFSGHTTVVENFNIQFTSDGLSIRDEAKFMIEQFKKNSDFKLQSDVEEVEGKANKNAGVRFSTSYSVTPYGKLEQVTYIFKLNEDNNCIVSFDSNVGKGMEKIFHRFVDEIQFQQEYSRS